MPPFVGAAAMQLLFGRSGSLNLILGDWFGFGMPFMEGLNAVIFVEALHYFPFILLNLTVALANIDSAMEESAQNLGASGFRLFRRIVFPARACLATSPAPRWCSSRCSTTSRTPLVLNVTNILAAQAYFRITSIGIDDPIGYVASVIMVIASMAALWGSTWVDARQGLRHAAARRQLARARASSKPWQAVIAYGWIVLVLLLVLSPHIGILLLSLSKVWSFSVVPDAYTLDNYATVFRDSTGMMWQYPALLRHRRRSRRADRHGNRLPDAAHQAAGPPVCSIWSPPPRLRFPGWCSASATCAPSATFNCRSPNCRSSSFWLIIAFAYTVRRLPYALRSCVAALQQVHVSLEEAAENLGANNDRTICRVVVPLMAGGILAGFVTSFLTAAVEMSATLMLVAATTRCAGVVRDLSLHAIASPGAGPAPRSA